MTFAMGETVAHLHLLWSPASCSAGCGDDGIYRFGAWHEPPGRSLRIPKRCCAKVLHERALGGCAQANWPAPSGSTSAAA